MRGRLVFRARTRGGRYELEAFERGDGTFEVVDKTHGMERGASVGLASQEECAGNVRRRMRDSLEVDNIRYSVVEVDELGVGRGH